MTTGCSVHHPLILRSVSARWKPSKSGASAPDGIDDGGISNKPEYGSTEKIKDDLRFIIPMQPNRKAK